MNKWQLKNVHNQSQYQAHTRTHASTPRSLGNGFFQIEYIKLIQYPFPLILLCQNMTLRSNYTMSKRDTPIQLYHVETWHSDPIIPCWNVTLQSNYTMSKRDTPIQEYRVRIWHFDPRKPCQFILYYDHFQFIVILFHQSFFIQGIASIKRVQENNSTISGFKTNHKTHNQATKSKNQVPRKLHNIIQCISITLKSLLPNNINHNQPPPKNQSQASYFSSTFPFLYASKAFQSIKYIYA